MFSGAASRKKQQQSFVIAMPNRVYGLSLMDVSLVKAHD